jgi:hypothetical protein
MIALLGARWYIGHKYKRMGFYMTQPKQKIILIGIVTVCLVGAGTVLIRTNQSSNKTNPTTKQSSVKAQTPATVYSPTDVVKDLGKYEGKTIAVRGMIQEIEANSFFVVGQEATPGAIKLDFGQSNLDPKNYANLLQKNRTTEKSPATKGPFTVTGKAARATKGGPIILLVQSIK